MSLAWLVDPPIPPAGPRGRVHLLRDDDMVDDDAAELERREARQASSRGAWQAAAAATPKPERRTTNADQARAHLEREAAKRGEYFLPLEPGQKRRRRAGPDGQPLKRGGSGKRGGAGYVRATVPAPLAVPEALLVPPAPPTPRAVPRAAPAPAARVMSHEEAIAVRQRARNRQPVNEAELLEANRIVDARRAEVRAMLERESYTT